MDHDSAEIELTGGIKVKAETALSPGTAALFPPALADLLQAEAALETVGRLDRKTRLAFQRQKARLLEKVVVLRNIGGAA